MPRLEGSLHGLKADPSARADDQDCRHGVMLPVEPAWLTVMCDAGSRTARWAGGLKRVSVLQPVEQIVGPPRLVRPVASSWRYRRARRTSPGRGTGPERIESNLSTYPPIYLLSFVRHRRSPAKRSKQFISPRLADRLAIDPTRALGALVAHDTVKSRRLRRETPIGGNSTSKTCRGATMRIDPPAFCRVQTPILWALKADSGHMDT
jgi:hypothetical protein